MGRFSYTTLAALALAGCSVQDAAKPYKEALQQQAYIVDTVQQPTTLRTVLTRHNVTSNGYAGSVQLDFMPRIPENKVWTAMKRRPLQPSDSVQANTIVYMLRVPEYATR